MKHAWMLVSVFLSLELLAAPSFPELKGRVVDNAHLLSAQTNSQISQALKNHEQESGNQIVVVTLNNLQGFSIEEYGYQLGRYWQIGQKDKDNGVLLIIAKSERKVRIEVGYGLEGKLTDAIASNIIHTTILPKFRSGQFSQGIEKGTTAIILALDGDYRTLPQGRSTNSQEHNGWLVLFIFLIIITIVFWQLGFGSSGVGGGYYGSSGGYRSGSFGRGGFSSGGGSFGGGGASGGW